MNATIALGALLLVASLTIAVPPSTEALVYAPTDVPDCEFLTLSDEFPFIIIDWDCPPPNSVAADGF